MKPKNYAVLVIAFSFSLFISSCEQDELATKQVSQTITPRTPGINRHYFDNGNPTGTYGVDYGCTTPAIECWDDVVVVGQKLNVVNDLFANIGSWDDADIQDFADENESDLSDIIGSSETTGIINGTYTLRVRGNSFTPTRFLITKYGSSLVSVTPIDN